MDSPRINTDQPVAVDIQPTSPRYTLTPSSSPNRGGAHFSSTDANRKVAVPIDLSDESAFAVRWAVQNYLREGDAVTLVHVRPTSVLYGADWGSTLFSAADDNPTEGGGEVSEELRKKKMEDDFESFTAGKIAEVAQPLTDAKIPFKVHVVKDHDMKERLCLEIERLGMSVVIMGSRGFGASRRASKGRLGSVSDYCVHHCVCPVVVVRYTDDREGGAGGGEEGSLHPVPEEEPIVQEHLHED